MHKPKERRKTPLARETQGEGVPLQQRRTEGNQRAEELAAPKRGNERADGRLIQRKRDARNPEGV
jgi:hypothetical protein